MDNPTTPAEVAGSKCDTCNDNKLYTKACLRYHIQQYHNKTRTTTVNGKQLCFTRRPEDGLFPCACGELISYGHIRKHASSCAACCSIAAKTRDDEPIDISPMDCEFVETSVIKNNDSLVSDLKCDQCNDGKLYSKHSLANHKKYAHTEIAIVRLSNKQLRFTRRSEDGLFPCACGRLLKLKAISYHLRNCDFCKKVVVKVRVAEPIDVVPVVEPWIEEQPLKAKHKKCTLCNDGRLYTKHGYSNHYKREHQEEIVVAMNKKQLRFRVNQKSNMFPCACGRLFKGRDISLHAKHCTVCKAVVAKLQDKMLVDINPPSGNENLDIDSLAKMVTDQLEQDDALLFEPEELRSAQLVIHRELKIILCKECKTIVIPKHAKDHLKKETHKPAIDPDTIRSVADYIQRHKDLLSAKQLNSWIDDLVEQQKNGPAISHIPILPLYDNGFKCTGCGYASPIKRYTDCHIRRSSCAKTDANILTNITLQQLRNPGGFDKWIHVDTNLFRKQQIILPDTNTDTHSSAEDPDSSDPAANESQATPRRIVQLQWDSLLDQLGQSGHQDKIMDAVDIPHESTSLNSWLIGMLVETIFEMEQRVIAERDKTRKRLGKSKRQIDNEGLDLLKKWRNRSADTSKDGCIMVGVKMVYALVELNKNTHCAMFLSQSDDLCQAVLDLTELVDRVIERINKGGEEEMDNPNGIDDEDHFTGLLLIIRIMRLLWVTKSEHEDQPSISHAAYRLLFLICRKEDEEMNSMGVRAIIDCFDYWARIAVDIHLQLQLSAWKAHTATLKGSPHKQDENYSRLVTAVWWDVLDASQKGREEQQLCLETAARKSPATITQRALVYIRAHQPTPFGALQRAKEAIYNECDCIEKP